MAKKITAIVSLVIVGILMITTLILANITVNRRINCADPNSVWVFTGTVWNAGSGRETSKEEKDKIVDLINNASKGKLLSTMFNGNYYKKVEIEKADSLINISTPRGFGYDYFVCYNYNNAQTLKLGNKDYKDDNGEKYLYKQLYFGVKSVEGRAVFDVYVAPYLNANGGVNENYNYLYRYQLTADFGELYNYLSGKSW